MSMLFLPSTSIFRPNFLIFDEPTNHLDVETVDALAKAFKKFKVQNKTHTPSPVVEIVIAVSVKIFTLTVSCTEPNIDLYIV